MVTTPAAGMSGLLSVVEDHVERAAVAGHARDRLADLVLRGQQERHGVEVVRAGGRRTSDLAHARDDALRRVQYAGEQDDHHHEDDEQDDVADPPECHRGLLSATIAALRPIPGSAPRMTSNCWLIALTAGSSGRRCSASTVSSAEPSMARPSEIRSRPRRTSIS